MKKVNLIRQLGNLDCASACIAMLFKFYRYNYSISEITAKLNIGRDGVTIRKIKEFVEGQGFSFLSYHFEYDFSLIDGICPCLCIDKKNHYIIIEGIKNGEILIVDPEKGKFKVTRDTFRDKYMDIVIIIRPENPIVHKNNGKILHIKFEKKKILIALIAMIVGQVSMLCLPFVTQYIVSAITEGYVLNTYVILTAVIGIAITFFFATFIRKRMILIMQNNMQKDIAYQIIQKIFKIDMRFFESHSTGDIVNRINSINTINDFLIRTVLSLGISLVTALICFIIMCKISIILTCFIAMVAIAQGLIIYFSNKAVKEKTNAYSFSQARLQNEVFEVLSNLLQIKSMGMNRLMNSSIEEKYNYVLDDYKDKTKSSDLLDCFISTISLITTTAIYYIGYILVMKNSIELAELVAYITLVSYFVNPIAQLALILPQTNMVIETISRIKEILLYTDHNSSGENIIHKMDTIVLKDVTFSYADDKATGVNHVNMEIKKGQKVAIVGLSGSGKSTLIKLLMNTLSGYTGKICINSIPIENISQENLFDKFSVVTQTPFMLNDTIRKNIDLFGEKNDDEINQILEVVKLREDISAFPLGLNTMIGENGQNISGGQKQRIAIARALIKKPEIVIFDEASSNLDPIIEKSIYENIQNKDLTQIIITHRMSTIKDADYIYVMEKGKVVEEGTHESLLRKHSLYYAMCTT